MRSHIYSALKSARGRAQQHAISDLKFLFRNLPRILSPVDWEAWGHHYPEPAGPGDRESILALVAAAEGGASAAIAQHWYGIQPEAFVVVRGEDGHVRGWRSCARGKPAVPSGWQATARKPGQSGGRFVAPR